MLVLAACYTAGLHGALLPFYSQFNAELAKCINMLNVQYSLVNMYSIQGLYRCLKMLEFDPEKSLTIGVYMLEEHAIVLLTLDLNF